MARPILLTQLTNTLEFFAVRKNEPAPKTAYLLDNRCRCFCLYLGLDRLHKQLVSSTEITPDCTDRYGTYRSDSTEQDRLLQYYKCVDEKARLFLERDFPESKDLSKAFLTLLTAVLVASITFSEKIVDINHAGRLAIVVMISSWTLLLAAIAACGSGLALITTAAGYAAYYPESQYLAFEQQAVKLWIAGGILFGVGLASLLVAGVISLIKRHREQMRST
jgi:hypothetical protein